MLNKLSTKGQMVLPKSIREMARLEAGDELGVGYSGGLIVLCKPVPPDPARVRRLMREGRKIPEMGAAGEKAVADAVAARADAIVSGDRKQFLPLGAYRGIPILGPVDFLTGT
jgi:AbrB family looped-hinge helix DNA binding protein